MKLPKLWLIVFSFTFITTLLNFSAFAQPAQPAQSLSFDGVDDYVDLPAFNFYNGPFTIEVWAKPNIIKEAMMIGVFNDNDDTGFDIEFVNGVEGMRTLYRNPPSKAGGAFILKADGTQFTNKWTHFAVVYGSDNRLKLYIDGMPQGTSGVIAPLPDNALTKIRLGYNWAGATRFLDGYMDEVRIWGTARTQAQIIEKKNCELQGNEAGLLVYYNFNQGVADGNNAGETTLNDLAGTPQNATLNNFALNGTSSNWVDDAPFSCSVNVDTDGDGIPDDTDPDDDNDGCLDADDSDPLVAGTDTDSDGIADECDVDDDNDGCLDVDDSNPLVASPDTDSDGIADDCDVDDDNDGCLDINDSDPLVAGIDTDSDGLADECDDDDDNDGCLDVNDTNPLVAGIDGDGDGVNDDCDNCASFPNSDQTDTDGDGKGDKCDVCGNDPVEADLNGNGYPDCIECTSGNGATKIIVTEVKGQDECNDPEIKKCISVNALSAWLSAPNKLRYEGTPRRALCPSKKGLSEINAIQNSFTLYPNPTSGKLFMDIESGEDTDAKIVIYDMSGRIVKAEQRAVFSGQQKFKLDISQLVDGIYFMSLQIGSEKYSKKFVKSNY